MSARRRPPRRSQRTAPLLELERALALEQVLALSLAVAATN